MTKPKMVDWYSPSQLIMTGLRTVMSSALGSMLDPRRLAGVEAMQFSKQVYGPFDSFDFMADTGDGWDSTYSMAYLLTQPTLQVVDAEGSDRVVDTLERPQALIMGGDQVYPVASPKEYENRLIDPFNAAWRDVKDQQEISRLSSSELYIVPGNHDWYDALGAFTHRFLATDPDKPRTPFKSFKNRQTRSYFVIELTDGWEVWGIDIQLSGGLDRAQNQFFADRARAWTQLPGVDPEAKTGQGRKIIVAMAEPDWVYGNLNKRALRKTFGRIVNYAESKRAKVPVVIAGDVHNYQRYLEVKEVTSRRTESYERHHIVSGGGGAFLHPTHGFAKQLDEDKADTEIAPALALYPSAEQSRRLSHKVLAFAALHWPMGLFIGVLYMLLFWHRDFATSIVDYPIVHPWTSLSVVGLIAGIFFFAWASGRSPDNAIVKRSQLADDDLSAREKRQRERQRRMRNIPALVLGLTHGLGHIIAAILCWKWAESAAIWLSDILPWSATAEEYVVRAAVVVFGMLVGGTLFGVYLWLSLNVFNFHHNEAFSALGSPHYKNFVRCRVVDASTVEIHALGVEKTAGQSAAHPVKVHRIEDVIRVSA